MQTIISYETTSIRADAIQGVEVIRYCQTWRERILSHQRYGVCIESGDRLYYIAGRSKEDADMIFRKIVMPWKEAAVTME